MTNLTKSYSHSKRYWHESCGHLNHRHKQTPRLDLVGKPIWDYNPLENRWRNFVRVTENPWIADYKIKDTVLFSHASMLCSVLEAARQIIDTNAKVQGFELRQVLLSRPPTIPIDDTGIAMTLQVKQHRSGTKSTESSWHEFTFYSEPMTGEEREISEHCSGLLQIHYSVEAGEYEFEIEATTDLTAADEYAKCEEACKEEIKPQEFYHAWKSRGIHWG